MDPWWPFILFLSLAVQHILFQTKKRNLHLPPGPPSIPILTTISYLSKSLLDIEPIIRNLRSKYGPVLTLRITSRPSIFISDHGLSHQALVHQGAIFADRLPDTEPNRIISCNRHNISSAPYGPLWRVLRRNLTSEILHPSRIRHFAGAREWVLRILLNKIREQAGGGDGVVVVMESFQFAMFCLLALMCFGEKLDVKKIKEIEGVQKALHRSFARFNVFLVLPKITKILFWRRWKLLLEIRRKQEEIFIPLIRARGENNDRCSYVDSLLELSIPEGGGRKLTEGEMVSLCSEFLSAGTDTTATALEWVMAELVRHGQIQKKLAEEIDATVVGGEEIKEEDLQKMPYLRAVVLEGLRRHPPGHYVLPHAVTEDTEIGGYAIPKNASINFTVAEMGWDEKVWDGPMEFKPHRFLDGGEGQGVDITGSREIKMMPFGAGRRICPGIGLAMLHLEYFVANLVREFEWKAVEGEEVDLSEMLELTVVMKNHLRGRVIPRREKNNMQCNNSGRNV